MNVLFFTESDLSPYTGGVERLTLNLVKELNKRDYQCYLGYFEETKEPVKTDFKKKFFLQSGEWEQQLKSILTINIIDICVINISSKYYMSSFTPILYHNTRQMNIRVIYGFYNMPGFELIGVNMKLAWSRFLNNNCNSNTINGLIAYYTSKLHINSFIKRRISEKLKIGLFSDEIVLLSEKYIPIYQSLIDNDSVAKFSAIGNPLSYPNCIDKEQVKEKQKIVIQVARFDDHFKRQTTALKIWKKIEETMRFDDWQLLMVGYGQDEKYIKHIAKKLKLKNIEFQGMQDPRENLAKAAIYINTSAFEGLPMILLDAQQYGVVPISFDSYASVTDIIEDGKNGLIVPNNNIKKYAEQLMFLMSHRDEREMMAKNGLISCQVFSTDKIVDKWEEVIKNDDYKN